MVPTGGRTAVLGRDVGADATVAAEPGMVLAYETPYYIKGLGGFIIEDQILITENGVEVMAASPRDLIEII